MYSLDCLCGQAIDTDTNLLLCPYCQRLIVIEWPGHERMTEHRNQRQELAGPAAIAGLPNPQAATQCHSTATSSLNTLSRSATTC